MPRDPRWYQIAVLGTLLTYGIARLGFDVSPLTLALVFTIGLCAQYLGSTFARIRFDPKSALISCLSLAALLRAEDPLWLALAALIAIGSKFVLRFRGKHLFNPTNFALAALLFTASPHIWVSPAQWGHRPLLALLMGCCGVLVVTRARRVDVTIVFLAAYAGMQALRAVLLAEPAAIPLHALQDGAVILFAFFMISDPKTTPDHPLARVLFAVWVAAIGGFIQLWLYMPRGLFYALFLVSLATPWLDWLFRGERYHWPGSKARHEEDLNAAPALPVAVDVCGRRPGFLRAIRRQS